MDMYNVVTSIATGFGLGITILLFSSITFIPASYVMNKFIYHAAPMRVIMGILAGMFSLLSFLIILGKRLSGAERVHYFGLFPVWVKTTDNEPTGWTAFLFKFLTIIVNPFMMFFLDGDIEPFKKTFAWMLVDTSDQMNPLTVTVGEKEVTIYKKVVNERFAKYVRDASTILDEKTWGKFMKRLMEPCQFIYKGSEDVFSSTSNVGAASGRP